MTVAEVSLVGSYICNTLEIVGPISLLLCMKENNKPNSRFFDRVSHAHVRHVIFVSSGDDRNILKVYIAGREIRLPLPRQGTDENSFTSVV